MRHRRRGENYANLVVNNDCTVTLDIDLPPGSTVFDPPGLWSSFDRRRYIQWELRRLRASPPLGLTSIQGSDLLADHLADLELLKPNAQAPLRIEAVINGPQGGPYDMPNGISLVILLPAEYPSVPPDLNIVQTLHHFFLDQDNGLPHIFYELLSDIAASPEGQLRFSLRDALRLLYYVLQAPLHPCAGCQEQYDFYARLNLERLETITQYRSLCSHKPLFDFEAGWRDEWFDPTLLRALESGDDDQLRAVVQELNDGVFSFPMLTPACCAMLIEEVEAYNASGLPTSRPNSMNKYGLVMNEIGMEPMFTSLQKRLLSRLARLLFDEEGSQLDRHHSFIVQYAAGKDLGLDMHTDNSDVTFNICLGKEFEGAGLTFCGYMGHSHHRKLTYQYKHVVGHCVVHLGRRRHGADDITTGERLNLIIWNQNLTYRNSKAYMDLQMQRRYEREVGPPDLVCLSYTHDRDYLEYKSHPRAHEKMNRRPWCPPTFAAHDTPEKELTKSSQRSAKELNGTSPDGDETLMVEEEKIEDVQIIQKAFASILAEVKSGSENASQRMAQL